jgi:hypothetical protein
MSKHFEKALKAVQQMVGEGHPEFIDIDPTHLRDVLESLEQAKRRRFDA